MIPADFFIASDVSDHTLLWGRGAKIYGDYIPQDQLDLILTEDIPDELERRP